MPNPNNPQQMPEEQGKKPGYGKDQPGQKAQPKTGQDNQPGDKSNDMNKSKKPGQEPQQH